MKTCILTPVRPERTPAIPARVARGWFTIPTSILITISLWFSALRVPARAAEAEAKPDDSGGTAAILAGHSLHGEAFNEGPRQRAYLMEGMPKIHFPITTKLPEAQQFFNQGIGQLHGFWYFEAERSFRQVAALDPECPMAYWGMAMANVNNEKRARDFMKKAVELKKNGGPRDVLWVEALDKFYNQDKGDNKKRHRQYVRSLEQIVDEFPEDIEAKAFLALKIWDNASKDIPISSHTAVDALANQVLAADPMHPLHHYRIHLWDNEKPARALNSASHAGQSSPGIAHMWHMPGHTYSKVHRYADAAWQQEASARVDHAHMIRDRILPDQIHNYAHNNEWLVRNLMYVGRAHDAVDLSRNLVELPRHPKYNILVRTNDSVLGYERRGGTARYGRERLAEVLVRFELWEELIALSKTPYLEPTDIPEEQVRRLRALGIAYFRHGETMKGREQIVKVEKIVKKLRAARQRSADAAEEKLEKEKQGNDKIAKAMTDALQAHAARLKEARAVLAELRGYAALATDEKERARELFEEAGNVPKDRLAALHLELGDKDKAIELARKTVEDGTNQVQLLANYADILFRSDKLKEAQEIFEKLRPLSSRIDLDVPVFQRLKPVAASLNLPEDWRSADEVAKDTGDRPPLETLGPFRWRPWAAPEWSLINDAGEQVTSQNYRGKPVVMIFYLGHGCSHCLEQLNAFAPAASEFAEAGISLVAVSTDSVEGLKKTFGGDKAAPFPLLSDAALDSFKAFRAYDDFEKAALHGTFLVDGQGLVRWQDINFEPFTDTKFLLAESTRLLKISEAQLMTKSGKKRKQLAGGLGESGSER